MLIHSMPPFFHATRPPKTSENNRFPCSKSPRRGLDNPSLVNCFTDENVSSGRHWNCGGGHPEGFHVIWWHQGNPPPGLPIIWWMILGRSHRHRLSRPIMFEWMWLQQKLYIDNMPLCVSLKINTSHYPVVCHVFHRQYFCFCGIPPSKIPWWLLPYSLGVFFFR